MALGVCWKVNVGIAVKGVFFLVCILYCVHCVLCTVYCVYMVADGSYFGSQGRCRVGPG